MMLYDKKIASFYTFFLLPLLKVLILDNTQMPNYKIAYNQGGATLAAFPVLSKIASIKRERSSADYNRPLVCYFLLPF